MSDLIRLLIAWLACSVVAATLFVAFFKDGMSDSGDKAFFTGISFLFGPLSVLFMIAILLGERLKRLAQEWSDDEQ